MSYEKPYAGLKVLDFSRVLAGPFAGRMLCDLGADVVKIEPPTGDPTRAGTGLKPGDPPSPYWLALHRDRRSVVRRFAAAAPARPCRVACPTD